MGILSKLRARRQPTEIKNNIPKEKENIRTTFAVYCNSHHGTSNDKLCPKCTALLATAMTKISRCPYGITKPICDRCEIPCFGEKATRDFRHIMSSAQKKMYLRHPLMALKHKLASWGFDYAKYEHSKKEQNRAEAKLKAAKKREKARKEEN